MRNSKKCFSLNANLLHKHVFEHLFPAINLSRLLYKYKKLWLMAIKKKHFHMIFFFK